MTVNSVIGTCSYSYAVLYCCCLLLLSDLIGGITTVTLGDETAKQRPGGAKTVLQRAAPPTFDVVVEMMTRHSWRVHEDVATAVDRLLEGV